MPDHWNELADQLGTPSLEPRSKMPSSSSGAKSEAAVQHAPKSPSSAVPTGVTPVDPPTVEEPPKSVKPLRKSSWDSVVEFFGLGSRSHAPENAQEPRAESKVARDAVIATTNVESHKPNFKSDRPPVKKTRPSMWGAPEQEEQPDSVSSNTVSLTAAREIKDPADMLESSNVTPSVPERSGPRRRPRRGGERQRMQALDTHDDELVAPARSRKLEDDDDLDDLQILETAERDERPEELQRDLDRDEDGTRRRKRRRRRSSSRRAGEDAPELKDERAELEDDGSDLESRDDERLQRAIRVKVPTWEEAMGSLIESNVANHQRTQPHGRRRTPPGRSNPNER